MDNWMKKLTLALCLLTLGSSTALAAGTDIKGDIATGQTKAALCVACHGPNGQGSPNPLWPKLAGQHASYIVQQLNSFKARDRQEATMFPMVDPLTEQDMHNLAAYFESQTPKMGSASQEWVTQGEKIYRGGIKETKVAACISCHGPQGRGNPAAKYPAINGQNAQYMLKQLKDYKNGTRKPKGNAAIMRDIAVKMSETEMEAVTNYMQGLY
jgi:cytochrome c553